MSVNAPIIEKASAGMREIFSALSSSEARYFDEERFSESEIRRLLSDTLTEKKVDAMKRILAHVSAGRDASPLFPDVVKNVSFQSLELKKLIYIYLVQYAENNRDLALLSINSFQKDLSDRSQLVRASALRAMASIKVLEVIQLVMVAVRTASSDSSAYVRKTAAQCMTKVYAVDPDQFHEIRTLLLKLMSDQEVQVVGSAVMAFHHICIVLPPRVPIDEAVQDLTRPSSEVGSAACSHLTPDDVIRLQLELLHPHFRRLCKCVLLMDSWAQQCCVDVLLRYCRLFFACPDQGPHEDLLAFLQTLKLLLSSSSKGVTVAAVVALCYLSPTPEVAVVAMPLLRCLRQAPCESMHALLITIMPVVAAKPHLIRPCIREFFVQSFDSPGVKELKLQVLHGLVDESNVQLVLRELQAYVSWHSHPEFVCLAVQSIAHVALKLASVADACLRGLAKMLDSKCEALACEAVVALRALLQRRQESTDSGLGSVLPHLARYLDDLTAPTARASVVWIVGQYQWEVPRLAPDVVRKLARTFASERQEVKQQIVGLALKVWAFHALNATGHGEEDAGDTKGAAQRPPSFKPKESAALLPRLEALMDHICHVASYDASWDVRDSARVLKRLKGGAKVGLDEQGNGSTLHRMGLWYCRARISGKQAFDERSCKYTADEGTVEKSDDGPFTSTWMLGSLAQTLDFPLDTYRPLPEWADVNSPDELRKVKTETAVAPQNVPKSISSANVGNMQHMEARAQVSSNITNMPVTASLEDLELFYEDDKHLGTSMREKGLRIPQAGAALEQGGSNPPVGTAVFGEDDESEDEDAGELEDEEDVDWKKYCPQARVQSVNAEPVDGLETEGSVEAQVEAEGSQVS